MEYCQQGEIYPGYRKEDDPFWNRNTHRREPPEWIYHDLPPHAMGIETGTIKCDCKGRLGTIAKRSGRIPGEGLDHSKRSDHLSHSKRKTIRRPYRIWIIFLKPCSVFSERFIVGSAQLQTDNCQLKKACAHSFAHCQQNLINIAFIFAVFNFN